MSAGGTNLEEQPRVIPLKRVGDFALPVLGIGTYQMGGGLARDWTNDDERDTAALVAAMAAGVTHIDTAEIYAGGHAERLVALAIQRRGLPGLFLTSKVYPTHLRYDDVIRACRGSLERLGIDQLDLYLVHGPNAEVPLAETMRAMDWLVDAALVRFIGVSNFDVPLLQAAQAASRHKIVTNQIHFSLVARTYQENGTLEYCRRHGILVTAYRPLGKHGELAIASHAMIDRMARAYGKTPAQIAINWVISQPNVVALVKTSNLDHLREDLGALGWKLEPNDAAELDIHFPRGETISGPRRG